MKKKAWRSLPRDIQRGHWMGNRLIAAPRPKTFQLFHSTAGRRGRNWNFLSTPSRENDNMEIRKRINDQIVLSVASIIRNQMKQVEIFRRRRELLITLQFLSSLVYLSCILYRNTISIQKNERKFHRVWQTKSKVAWKKKNLPFVKRNCSGETWDAMQVEQSQLRENF